MADGHNSIVPPDEFVNIRITRRELDALHKASQALRAFLHLTEIDFQKKFGIHKPS